MRKLLLINPVGRRSGLLLSKFLTFSRLALAYVAAVTPSSWVVKIADEIFDKFEFEAADLVDVAAFTSNIKIAYEIAEMPRKRKTKVIMGGEFMCPSFQTKLFSMLMLPRLVRQRASGKGRLMILKVIAYSQNT